MNAPVSHQSAALIFPVEGMSCASCVTRVEAAAANPGQTVTAAAADLCSYGGEAAPAVCAVLAQA